MCPAFLYSDSHQAEETSLTHDIGHCQTKSDQVKGQSRVQSLNYYHLALCGNLYKFPSLIFSLELVLLHPQPVSPSYSYCVVRHCRLPKAQVWFSYFAESHASYTSPQNFFLKIYSLINYVDSVLACIPTRQKEGTKYQYRSL